MVWELLLILDIYNLIYLQKAGEGMKKILFTITFTAYLLFTNLQASDSNEKKHCRDASTKILISKVSEMSDSTASLLDLTGKNKLDDDTLSIVILKEDAKKLYKNMMNNYENGSDIEKRMYVRNDSTDIEYIGKNIRCSQKEMTGITCVMFLKNDGTFEQVDALFKKQHNDEYIWHIKKRK